MNFSTLKALRTQAQNAGLNPDDRREFEEYMKLRPAGMTPEELQKEVAGVKKRAEAARKADAEYFAGGVARGRALRGLEPLEPSSAPKKRGRPKKSADDEAAAPKTAE